MDKVRLATMHLQELWAAGNHLFRGCMKPRPGSLLVVVRYKRSVPGVLAQGVLVSPAALRWVRPVRPPGQSRGSGFSRTGLGSWSSV